MSSSSKDEIPDPFSLIERGVALERARNHWGASDFFSKASNALSQKSIAVTKSTVNTDEKRHKEQKKIADLYRQEALHYFNRSRKMLIEAMEFEHEEDLKRNSPPSDNVCTDINQDFALMSLLCEEESRRRMHIFHRLYASSFDFDNEIRMRDETARKQDLEQESETLTELPSQSLFVDNDEDPFQNTSVDGISTEEAEELYPKISSSCHEEKDVKDLSEDPDQVEMTSDETKIEAGTKAQEISLEERLAALESSLGQQQNLKSDSRRLDEIHDRVSNMGIYVPQRQKGENILETKVVSEEEQFDEIMNHAMDEVIMDGVPEKDSTDVEKILKQAGIRIELPLEDENSIGRHSLDLDKGFDKNILQKDDLKDMIEKTQQLLFQVSAHLDDSGSSSSQEVSTSDEEELEVGSESGSEDCENNTGQGLEERKTSKIGSNSFLEANRYMELLTKSLEAFNSQKK